MRKIPKNKKQIEKLVFDIFQDKYDLVGEFKQASKDSPGPDFVGFYNENILGVEITVIYSDEKTYSKTLKEHEQAKERIVSRACERAEISGLPPLDVQVIFSDNIPKGKESCLTESLFEIVKNNIPGSGDEVVFDSYRNLPHGFALIAIENRPHLKKPFWDCCEAEAIETRFSKQLQRIIDEKSGKYPTYLEKCSKCWLIIAALGFEPSSFYGFSEDMETSCYTSPFEKVFFMEVFSETLKELKIL